MRHRVKWCKSAVAYSVYLYWSRNITDWYTAEYRKGSFSSLSANQNPWWRQRTCPLPFSFEASPTSQQTGAGPPAAAQGKTSEATSTPKTPPRQKSSDIIPTISRDICALAHVPRTLTVSLPERRIRSWQRLRSETRHSRKRRPLALRKIPKRRYRGQENKKIR